MMDLNRIVGYLNAQIFKRLKAFNLVQMTHFVTERLSTNYERRLLDYANYWGPR